MSSSVKSISLPSSPSLPFPSPRSAYVPCEAQGLDAVQLALEQIDVVLRFTVLYDQYTRLVTSSKEIVRTHAMGQLASMIGVGRLVLQIKY